MALYSVFESLSLEVGVLAVLKDADRYCDYRGLRGEVVGTSLHPFEWGGGYPDETYSKLEVSVVFSCLIERSLTSNNRTSVGLGHQKNFLALRS